MARDKISIKFLIHLVGERPALWDKSSPTYKDRSLKDTSWREICAFINEEYDHMQPDAKLEYSKMVTKKWTHIRDSWVKSMKYGYDEKTKLPPKPYVYHDELKFLQKILRCRRRRFDFVVPSFGRIQEGKQELTQHSADNTEDHELSGVVENTMDTACNKDTWNELINHAEDDDGDDEDWPAEVTQPSAAEIKRETNRTMVDQEISQHTPQPQIQLTSPRSLAAPKSQLVHSNYCNEKHLNDNRHRNFFKGIFPSLATLDDDQTLQFQAGVITLVQKLKALQKQIPARASKKKRKMCDDEDTDYEWAVHQVNLTERYSRRSAKHSNDPIAEREAEDEQESSSVNMDYIM